MISHIQNVVTLCERLEEGLSEYIDDTLAADVDSALVLLFLVQPKDKYQNVRGRNQGIGHQVVRLLD